MATRREFLKKGSLAAAAGLAFGLVGPVKAAAFEGFFQVPSGSASNPINTLTAARFEPLIGSGFTVRQPGFGNSKVLNLLDVTELKFKQSNEIKQESFSVLLEKSNGTRMDSGIYEIYHPSLGRFNVFISPVTDDPNLLEINFSKLVS